MDGALQARETAPTAEDVAARLSAFRYWYPEGDRPALDGIDLVVPRGGFVGVMGPTGAGKSTLCLTFNGLVPQLYGGRISGAARVFGQDVATTPTATLALGVGMVLEDPESQITGTTVESEVAFALENARIPRPEMRERVDEALEAVGLQGMQRKHPANLSGGQKQRLAIAAALALRPGLIVLDEPTSQLDPQAAAHVYEILAHENRTRGLTVVIASHAAEELAATADRIVVMDRGRIALDGPPGEVLSRVEELEGLAVRPPDIARSVSRLASGQPPVTLEEALRRERPYERPARPPRAGPAGAPALSVDRLSHVYDDGTRALDGVGLDLPSGSFTAITGHNGSGKSTLVKHFVGLLGPTEGCVRVGGRDVAGLTVGSLARSIAFVAQNAHRQLFCDSVSEEVGFALRMQKRPPSEIADRVGRALDEMDLAGVSEAHPAALSRGDQLRVAIAAFLALDPEVLIFDEPTTGQDWRGAMAIIDVLRRLHGRGRTVVLITHHLYLLGRFVDRMIVMKDGRVHLDGAPEAVLYEGAALEECGIVPPQTVRFAQATPGLTAARPIGPDDLETLP